MFDFVFPKTMSLGLRYLLQRDVLSDYAELQQTTWTHVRKKKVA